MQQTFPLEEKLPIRSLFPIDADAIRQQDFSVLLEFFDWSGIGMHAGGALVRQSMGNITKGFSGSTGGPGNILRFWFPGVIARLTATRSAREDVRVRAGAFLETVWPGLVLLEGFPRRLGLRIQEEEVFGDFVLLVFFRTAFRDLGTDANAKVAEAVGPAGALGLLWDH